MVGTVATVDQEYEVSRAFEVTTSIDRPVDRVWSRLTDWPHAPEWMSGVESVRADDGTAVGATLTFRARGKDRRSEITALEPGRSIALTSVQGGVRADYIYTCVPDGEGTRVRLVADCHTSGAWRLAGRLIRAAIRRADSGQLEALKRVLEAGEWS